MYIEYAIMHGYGISDRNRSFTVIIVLRIQLIAVFLRIPSVFLEFIKAGIRVHTYSKILGDIWWLILRNVFVELGESAHITHSAQSRTNVRKSLIVCNMT